MRLMWLTARLLPSPLAAALGAALLRVIGPLQRKHTQVLRNLHQVMPTADPARLRRTARDVWANLGAVIFEYPHLAHISRQRVTVTMAEPVRKLLAAGQPGLFVTAHTGNWEVLASYMGSRPPGMVVVYSPDPNDTVQRLIQTFRAPGGCEYVTKQDALRRLNARYLAGRSVGLLPDVRVDSGPAIPLFGMDAPTTISPARIAARLGYPVIPARAKRLGPARFELEFLAPLEPGPGLKGKPAAIDLMRQFNELLESWIDERPGEWLCTKRRWPKATGR